MLYADALKIFNKIQPYIAKKFKCRVKMIGSLRRKKPIVRDIDFLIVSKNPKILQEIELPNSIIKESGDFRKKIYLNKYGLKIDLFYTNPDCLAFAMLHHTGSRQFNIRTRFHAKKHGFKLNQYGLYKGKKRYGFKTEREILNFLGITYKTPMQREE
jgi:DNA polymerase (family 10)